MSSRVVHMCIDIRGIMSKPKSQRRNLCRKPDGSYMTPDEAWNALADELAKGRRVLPFGAPCEGFSYETGCPGHPQRIFCAEGACDELVEIDGARCERCVARLAAPSSSTQAGGSR